MPSAIQTIDPAFHTLVDPDARLQRVAAGFRFAGGPVFSRIGFLLFSDTGGERIMKWTPEPGKTGPPGGRLTVFRRDSHGAHGLTFDHQGRLLACERAAGRVIRTEKDGKITVLAEKLAGKLLNAPNDLIYAVDGSIYFSDLRDHSAPPDPSRTDFSAVYQITREGEVRVATHRLERPKGVALGPKQLTLYVTDSGRRKVWRYHIGSDGSLSDAHVVARLESDLTGGPAGLNTDEAGNLYVAGPEGVWVFSAAGRHLGTVVTPESASNCAWGAAFTGLYITTRTSVYYVATKVRGTRTF
ncbi:SMP-30/gluconolactonase/LRE family protein [Acidobacteria bacterium AH-259-L09]|nr:SMP-30/gluconolactonase/LRE family protein [Acidobacteria bacterium AH-259-L09]